MAAAAAAAASSPAAAAPAAPSGPAGAAAGAPSGPPPPFDLWTKEEEERFLAGLATHGLNRWSAIVPSADPARAHLFSDAAKKRKWRSICAHEPEFRGRHANDAEGHPDLRVLEVQDVDFAAFNLYSLLTGDIGMSISRAVDLVNKVARSDGPLARKEALSLDLYTHFLSSSNRNIIVRGMQNAPRIPYKEFVSRRRVN